MLVGSDDDFEAPENSRRGQSNIQRVISNLEAGAEPDTIHRLRENGGSSEQSLGGFGDPNYVDFISPIRDKTKGGIEANPVYRDIAILCHSVRMPAENRSIENAQLRCPASRLCGKVHNHHKFGNRLLPHAVKCAHLLDLDPTLTAKARRLSETKSLSSRMEKHARENSTEDISGGTSKVPMVKRQRVLMTNERMESDSDSVVTATSASLKVNSPFISFAAQGRKEYEEKCDFEVVMTLLQCGIATRVVDSRRWRA